MIEINEKKLVKELRKLKDERLEDLKDYHYYLYLKLKEEFQRRHDIITK